jgi:AcrR family transcriptional regulator
MSVHRGSSEDGHSPGSPSRTRRQKDVSTRRLLEAAAKLIAERGYEKTTLLAIGREAGYSAGLVTQRFGSKDGMLHALVQRMTTEWGASQIAPRTASGDGLDAVAVMLEGIRDSATGNPDMVRALYVLMFEAIRIPVLHDDMVKLHRNQRAHLANAIENAQKHGEARTEVDGQQVANLMVAALRGISYQWLLDPEFPFQQTITDLIQLVQRDLAPRNDLCRPSET